MIKNFVIPVFVLMIITNSLIAQDKNCTDSGCHQGLVTLKVIHDPVVEDCSTCHQQFKKEHPKEGSKEFKLVSNVPELCESCHDLAVNEGGIIHAPVKSGDCLGCHNPHGSKTAKLLKNDRLCDSCHDLELSGKKIHGPVAGYMCSACHAPHQSKNKYLLIRDGLDLCVFCHTAKMDREGVQSVHEPFEKDCYQCHQPHASKVKYLLDTDVPELCYNCHKTVEVDLSKKSEVHGPFQKGGKCYLCHNAHTSPYKSLLMDKEEKLCFTCHNQKIKKDGRIVKDIELRVTKSEYVHGPVKSDGCSVCHAAHTPDNFFLLSAAFPKGAYSSGKVENFAHCFDCHDSALMIEAESREATNFRDGSKNLHYIHVNREKARNCTTCHDIHGSNYPFIIAETVPFGNWEMPMNFKVTENGGSCLTGCHQEFSYARD
jgi:predicted CXXCH cytochrome family protein